VALAFEQRLTELARAPKGATTDDLASAIASLQDKIGEGGRPAPGSAELGVVGSARDKLLCRLGVRLRREALGAARPRRRRSSLSPMRRSPSTTALAAMFTASARAIISAQKPAGGQLAGSG
jgi:hypothetical protein